MNKQTKEWTLEMEQNEIWIWSVDREWIGEWFILSPDCQSILRVTDEGEPRSYADALEGIREAVRECSTDDNRWPFYEWFLDCKREEV